MKRPGRIFSAWGYFWSFINTLVGVLLLLPYGAHSFKWHQGVLTCLAKRIIGDPGAQTHGYLIFFANEQERQRPDLRVHEYTHVWQGFIGGPFFMLAYVAHFLWRYCTTQSDERPGWYDDYHGIFAENDAYHEGDNTDSADWGY